MKRISILILLVFFSCSSPVLAAKYHARQKITDPVTLALKLAEQYWGTIPCEGHIVLHEAESPPAILEAGPMAPLVANGEGFVLAWTQPTTCEITFNSIFWHGWYVDDLNFQWFCDAMTHEVGHLPPLNHEDDGQVNPRSIEYPNLEPGSPNYNSVPQCLHVRLQL